MFGIHVLNSRKNFQDSLKDLLGRDHDVTRIMADLAVRANCARIMAGTSNSLAVVDPYIAIGVTWGIESSLFKVSESLRAELEKIRVELADIKEQLSALKSGHE